MSKKSSTRKVGQQGNKKQVPLAVNETSLKFQRRGVYVALAGAAIGLVFGAAQMMELRNHNHLSIQPHLTLALQDDVRLGDHGWYLSNNGLGPAVIQGFQLYVDDRRVASTAYGGWLEVISKLGLKAACFSMALPGPGTAISPSATEHVPLLRWDPDKGASCRAEFDRFLLESQRIAVRIDYESMDKTPGFIEQKPTRLI